MFSTVLSWLEESLNFAINVFTSFVSGSFLSLFLSMFMILLVYRLIIKPIIGSSSGSDKVKRKKGDE